MVIVHDSDHHKYYDKQQRVEIIKYSSGVKKTAFSGGAFYLPRRLYDGDGLLNDIVIFVSDNKDTIKNIASVTSSVADSVGNSSNAINVVRKIKELKNKQPITDDAMNKVLTATDTPTTGNGFFYV